MSIRTYIKSTTGLSKVTAAAFALLAATPALAEDVTLVSSDGTVNIVGEFVDFTENSYIVRTALGELRISASRVRCEGAACPVFEGTDADVTFAGSDTVGLGIMPLLIEGYAGFLGAEATRTVTANSGEILVEMIGDGGFGDELASYLVTSTSSGDAFTTLLDGSADIGMASRRIRPDEARQLRDAGLGNMVSPAQEHIIAVDSLVVITHPTNPITTLSTQDLAAIYAGEITNWNQVGGDNLAIQVIGRQAESGTASVFNDRVFGGTGIAVTDAATIADDNTQMATLVNADPSAIGFVGYAFQRGAKALSLVNECGLTMTPDAFSARTEEYALQRRLYMYNSEDISPETQAIVDYAMSSEADDVILKSGFVGLGVDRRTQPLDGERARMLLDPSVDAFEGGVMREMLATMVDYDRMSTTFRFNTGSSRLDERAVLDMARLTEYLQTQPAGTNVLFVGFTDDVGAFEGNRFLSQSRADQVMADLRAFAGDSVAEFEMATAGFGEVAPSACNSSDEGRRINRRVEVWIQAQNG